MNRFGLGAVKNAKGAVNIHTAHRNDSIRDALKYLHQDRSLSTRTEDHIYDDIGIETAKTGHVVCKLGVISEDFFNVRKRRVGLAAMKDCNPVPKALQFADYKSADETSGAENKTLHHQKF